MGEMANVMGITTMLIATMMMVTAVRMKPIAFIVKKVHVFVT